MGIVDDVINAMYEAELAITGKPAQQNNKWGGWLRDIFIHTPAFLWVGMKASLWPIIWTAVVAFVIGIYISLISLWDNPIRGNDLVFGSVFFAAGFIAFLLPSRSATRGLKSDNVDRLTEYFQILEPERVGSILAGIDVVKERALERVQRMTWTLGIGWAAAAWFVSNEVLSTQVLATTRGANAGHAFVGIAILGFVAVAVLCYAAATRILYQTLDLAFIQCGADK